VPGEARNAIAAAFGSLVNIKHVVVIDPDIDITSDEQMDWALATRFQADRDLVVEGGFRTLPLDPSLNGGKVGGKAGFDLTWPFGTGNRMDVQVPESPKFAGKRFATLEAALEDGPKYFEDLMAALASRDGREIVRQLDVLRASRGIARDELGRYHFAK
jgi:3-polyprenyl-4-hydroxybenzoate decarboxylase